MLLFLNVIYVLIALAMVALILMQRGAGAQAGSGFGGGASGTVFGARGASNFLSKSTKWLAIAFFSISLFMAWQAQNRTGALAPTDLGLMSQPASPVPAAPAGGGAIPAAPMAPGAVTPPAVSPAVPAAERAVPPVQEMPARETSAPATSPSGPPSPLPPGS